MALHKNKMTGASTLTFALGLMLATGALAQAADDEQAAKPASVPVTTSVAEADAKLLDVKQHRAAVEATYADSERYCYTKFFVNNCLDKAKEIRRAELAHIRPIEIEASHFKRADAVAKRDAALVVDAKKASDDAAARAAKPVVVNEVKPAPPPKTPNGPTLAQREAQLHAKQQQQQAEDAANAPKRAANVTAYAQRQADAAKEQQRVADKAAQRAADQRKKAADKAAADAAAAAAAAAASAKQP